MDSSNWFEWLLGIFVAVFAWIGKRLHDRVESAHEKMSNAVTRSEFYAEITELRTEQRDMHEQNGTKLDRIHDRVDALYRNGGSR